MTLGVEEFLESSTLHNPPVVQDDDLIHVRESRFGWNPIGKEPVAGRRALAAVDVLSILNYPTAALCRHTANPSEKRT
jgi:hypothetical protein